MQYFSLFGTILMLFFGINMIHTYFFNKKNKPDDYNHVLFYISFFNCIVWLLYSVIIHDIYIYISILTIIIGNFGLILQIYQTIPTNKLKYIELVSLTYLLYYIIIIFLYIFTDINKNILIMVSGSIASISTIINNLSPLIIIKRVIYENNLNLIYLPQALIGFINLILWLLYSIEIQDYFQLIANLIGSIICFIQLIVYAIIYLKNKKIDTNNNSNINNKFEIIDQNVYNI